MRSGSLVNTAQTPQRSPEGEKLTLHAYVFIGNGEGGHRAPNHGGGPCTLHNPSYDFNDALIPLGATYWVQLARRWLGQAQV